MRSAKLSSRIGVEKIAMTFACAIGLLLLAIGAVATPVDSAVTTSQISVSAVAPVSGTTPPP